MFELAGPPVQSGGLFNLGPFLYFQYVFLCVFILFKIEITLFHEEIWQESYYVYISWDCEVPALDLLRNRWNYNSANYKMEYMGTWIHHRLEIWLLQILTFPRDLWSVHIFHREEVNGEIYVLLKLRSCPTMLSFFSGTTSDTKCVSFPIPANSPTPTGCPTVQSI